MLSFILILAVCLIYAMGVSCYVSLNHHPHPLLLRPSLSSPVNRLAHTRRTNTQNQRIRERLLLITAAIANDSDDERDDSNNKKNDITRADIGSSSSLYSNRAIATPTNADASKPQGYASSDLDSLGEGKQLRVLAYIGLALIPCLFLVPFFLARDFVPPIEPEAYIP